MNIKNSLFLCIIITGLFSCVGSRKMKEVTARLQNMEATQAAENNKTNTISSLSVTKLTDGKIDSNINARFDQRLSPIKMNMDSIGREISYLKSLTSDIKTFRKNYKKQIVPRLAQLDTFYKKYDDRLKIYVMLEDGLSIANYTLFDLAAFFGPGLYTIPAGQEKLVSQSFLPLIDSLIKFSNKYQALPRTATLVVLGFADGQDFDRCSELYDTLSEIIEGPVATKQLLNQKLSELRALELIKQLTTLFTQKASDIINIDKLNVEYVGQGKGEEYPIPTIKDYQLVDERRRIVLCYWAVLPDKP